MEVACNLISGACKYTFLQTKRCISYVFHHERRVENFNEKVERLKERRESVQHAVDAAKRNAEKIETGVQNWLSRVDKFVNEEAKELKDLEDKAKNKCFIGLCPNFKSRYQLSKRAEEDAKAVDDLLPQGKFSKVSYRDPPQAIVDASRKDFEAFDSRKQLFNDIMEALKDPSINIVGVYGMGGVGKTTLVKQVAKQIKEDKLFHSVVMAAVTQTPDIQSIQDQIAVLLGLKLEEKSVLVRAIRLKERLKEEKSILVVLDDIWAKLDLEEVGIPIGNEHKGCSLLLTSRNLNVLSNGMDAQRNFPIDVLKPEEAWNLFKKMSGISGESPELLSIATDVAKKCAGLPIAISTVARALRNKGLYQWKDALRQLQRPSSSNFGGVPANAYAAIVLSYNHLESEELKQTFLLSNILGRSVAIQDMLKYSMGLGLFNDVITVEEARNRLLTVVSDLKTSCLLLDSYTNQRFDWLYMHDLIRDVGISIATRDNHAFAFAEEGVQKDWPDAEAMKSCDKISLWHAGITKFPDQLKCPKLTFFLVGSSDPSMEIPTNFFKDMKNLKVLDLTHMHFLSLPSSISLLSNLRTLCLDHSVLGDIAIIGELKNLEILSLWNSDIELLPKEVGQLMKLKLLDLTGCTELKIIQPNVLSSLSRLEELYMGNSFKQWEAESHTQQSKASLAEFKALSCLTALDVHIPHANIIPSDFFFEKLQRYKIFIGEAWDWDWHWDGKIDCSRTLKLKLNTSIRYLNHGLKMLLNKAENLHLDEITGAEIWVRTSDCEECFRQLKNLNIQSGALIQYIIKDDVVDKIEFLQLQSLTLQGLPKLITFCSKDNSSTSISQKELPLFNDKITFPKLEKLKLSSLNIERIWHYQLLGGSYSIHNLTSLIIEGCHNLKHILSSSIVECLHCRCIPVIVTTEEIKKDETKATISFPRLISLKLKNLQKLIGFCSENYFLEFPSLKILEIDHCLELKGFINKRMSKDITTGCTTEVLFNEQVAFPNLEKVTISHLRNIKRLWYNQLNADSFRQMKELKAGYCDELLTIFPSSVLGVFQRLEILTVANCGSLEQVFELQVQGLKIKDTCGVALRLEELYLYHLPELKHVWNEDPQGNISFQTLRVVKVSECGSLKSLFPFSIAKGLSQLERLIVEACGVEEIVSKNEELEQEIRFEFNKLSSLILWDLTKLKCFYPGKHTTRWPVLKSLTTYWVEKIKIFEQPESHLRETLLRIEKLIPQLEEMSFSSGEIATICGGQFLENVFCNIKVLWITCYLKESTVFPVSFLRRFNSLELLEVCRCYFQELSPCEGNVSEEKEVWMYPKIKMLRLKGLPNLTNLWKKESLLGHICASLETLEVWRCDGLISLGASSASFENLTTLNVWQCKGIVELVTSSKAQSLVHLVVMRIRECEMMEKVVVSKGDDEATYEIIFRDLKHMELHCLASLRSFCSRNYNFKFPSLEQVIVSQCPRLKTFCHGVLKTPKLQGVQLEPTHYKGRWAGDLNAAVQLLYKEQNVQISEEKPVDTI